MEHKYEHNGKQYILIKNGTKDCPWNVYEITYSKWLDKNVPSYWGYGETMKQCKADIDEWGE